MQKSKEDVAKEEETKQARILQEMANDIAIRLHVWYPHYSVAKLENALVTKDLNEDDALALLAMDNEVGSGSSKDAVEDDGVFISKRRWGKKKTV